MQHREAPGGTRKIHMQTSSTKDPSTAPALIKSVVLVGLMGAGKTSIGRLLAAALGVPFVDADAEIEAAAGRSVSEIFETRGEAEFRAGERRVMARLLKGPIRIIASGGGAFIDSGTRAQIGKSAVSVWLKADIDTLAKRVARRHHRPLIKGQNAREVLSRLMAERDPFYATADITVETADDAPEMITGKVISGLENHLGIAPLAVGGNRGHQPAAGRAKHNPRKRQRS
jgi:shikimate kinase